MFLPCLAGLLNVRLYITYRLPLVRCTFGIRCLLLIYEDTRLHPTEKATEFEIDLSGEARSVLTRYFLAIAGRSVRPEHMPKLAQLQQAAQSAPPGQQAAQAKAFLDFFTSLDPFTREKYRHISDFSQVATLSLETLLKDAEEAERKAASLSVALSPQERTAMTNSLAFWRGRIAANRTMADNTGVVANQSGARMVALNLGAAHTQGVVARVAEQGRPFAVTRPASLDAPDLGIDLDLESLGSLETGGSLFTEGLVADLLRIYPVDVSIAQPAANQPWAQAELELFFYARRLA